MGITEENFEEHILVCLSPSPSNEKIIRTAAKMAEAFKGKFTALFVETPDHNHVLPEDKLRLKENEKLAERLGAACETVYGEDVPYQIAEYARLSKVTKIVLGRSVVVKRGFLRKPTLTEQLTQQAPEIEIHIIPDKNAKGIYHPVKKIKYHLAGNIVKSVGILGGVTILSLLFEQLGFTNENIIMVYILGVLLISAVTSLRVYSLICSIISVFVFNYFFTPPRFSLAYETGYPVTFIVMFLTAFITSTFALRYKEQAGQIAKVAYRTKILFDTNQLISKEKKKEKIITTTAEQIVKLLGRRIVVFDADKDGLTEPSFFGEKTKEERNYDKEKECMVAEWVYLNNHMAGATTDRFPSVAYLYFALRVNDRVYGVVGIEACEQPLDAFEHSILLSVLGECALALENEKNVREKEAAAVLVESEQLRANLLRAISHDLRTPLTSISGNAANLLKNEKKFDDETKNQLYSDIYDDSMWLVNLVENLLSATRIEDGQMKLRILPEVVDDIIDEAVKHIDRRANQHKIIVETGAELLLVKVDARLIVQVIINIVDNAIKYTEENSEIRISVRKCEGMAEIVIADNGRGIPDNEKERIFDKFYCGEHESADNRRSLGLGLYLCKSIVEAHGGKICVMDNQPKGAVFSFTLPLKEVLVYE